MENHVMIEKFLEVGKLDDNGKKTGLWRTYNNNGSICTTHYYSDGVYHGLWEAFVPTRKHTEKPILFRRGYYVHGEKVGLSEMFHRDGKILYRTNLIKGNNDGLWQEFHKNGKIKTLGNYIMGKQVGVWDVYSEKGKLEEIKFYV